MSKGRILVVEDEPDIAFALKEDLTLEGYEVEVVTDGETAIRQAVSRAFTLILLDMMLPRKDGFEVCRELRRSGVSTPIILLTARSEEADRVLGLEMGADDYLAKPFSPREMVAVVGRGEAFTEIGAGARGGGSCPRARRRSGAWDVPDLCPPRGGPCR